MKKEEIKKLPSEERLAIALVDFSNSVNGNYEIKKLAGSQKLSGYGECISFRMTSDSGSFLAGVKLDDHGEITPLIFTMGTPKGDLYNQFCNYIMPLGRSEGMFKREEH